MPITPTALPDDETIDSICDLSSKLDALDRPRKMIAAKTGIKEDTLKSDANRGSMSRARQRLIAAAYNFSVDHTSWRDPRPNGDQRKDTIAQFRKYIFGPGLAIVASASVTKLRKGFARLRVDGLNVTQSTPKRDEPLGLLDEGDLEPCDIGAGVKVGLAQFRLVIGLPERDGVAMRRSDRQTRADKAIAVTARSTDEAPEFDYVATRPPFNGHFRGDEELGLCRGLQAGDTLEIVAKAMFDDAFVEKDGPPLGDPLKERLREALSKIEAMGFADGDGWVILCSQQLKVREAS